jgi:predicted enzyme related to lactoylglutathione lyase
MSKHEKLNCVEFPAKDIPATKRFFESVFNWSFTDFGEAYTTFENKRP